MVLSSWQSHCENSPGSFDECRLSAGWPPTLRPSQPTCTASPPERNDSYRSYPPSLFCYYRTQPESLYSFYHPTEGGRLSRRRHCSKGVQPVPKAVHRSGCRDKHNCPHWHSNLGPLTPQSGMLPLDHWDTAGTVSLIDTKFTTNDVARGLKVIVPHNLVNVSNNKYACPPYCGSEMYAGRVACCSVVSTLSMLRALCWG